MPLKLIFPQFAKTRGPGFWLNPLNLWASRRKFLRPDYSNEWRYAFEAARPPRPDRTAPFTDLLAPGKRPDSFTFVVVGDTGEGDRSQYSLVPLLRLAQPDFMIINGDVAYPTGDLADYDVGFFRPYAGMNIPIWATPGNHEYYSSGNGAEFYEIFCTRRHHDKWSAAGLRLVPQPGMYWELRDPTGATPLVVIGIDSGKHANLDGHKGLFTRLNPFDHAQPPDTRQHKWLEDRLTRADENGDVVMVLFHIPALVSGKDDKVHLAELHRVIARHKSVRMVVCGHIHNHQQYAPETFRDFMNRVYNAPALNHPPPEYIVSGNGGATVDGTRKIDPKTAGKLDYGLKDVFPTAEDWDKYVKPLHKAASAVGGRSVLARALGAFSEGARDDVDPAGLQSFLLVRVAPGERPKVQLIALHDLAQLYSDRAGLTEVDVLNSMDLLNESALDSCCREPIVL